MVQINIPLLSPDERPLKNESDIQHMPARNLRRPEVCRSFAEGGQTEEHQSQLQDGAERSQAREERSSVLCKR